MSTLQNYELEHPLMNAAGTCRRPDEIRAFAKSAVAAIMIGSITKEARGGNPGSVWAHQGGYTLNSLGMPNQGAEYYQHELPDMVRVAHDAGKSLIVSVAGFSPSEYLELALLALESGADFVELNLGCPNIWADGAQKPIPSFNLDVMAEILRLIKEEANPRTVGVKISPYSNPEDRETFAGFLKECGGHLAFVTATNTFPNALAYGNDGKPLIAESGYGGLGGQALKPIALAHVRQFADCLRGTGIQIIGAGGISSGQDVTDYLAAGAGLVQVASHYLGSENLGVFGDILTEWVTLGGTS